LSVFSAFALTCRLGSLVAVVLLVREGWGVEDVVQVLLLV
jgi:hypothetical protein